jgi:hypothetical protein
MSSVLPRYRVRLVHLIAIWAYGVSQPVFALIDGNPDLLLSRDATRASVALFAVLLALAPPALMVGYAWLAGRYSRWIGDRIYVATLAACLVPVPARFVKQLDTGLLLSSALIVGLVAGGVWVYLRSRAVRMFLGYSIVLVVASFIWLMHGIPNLTEDAKAAGVRVPSPVPVVFIQLDEMSASSLMARDGRLDAVRYPGFGRLARDGTWYPNATPVHEWTSEAVPSILSGVIGKSGGVPILQNHPDNLFTLLGGSYTFQVHETATRLCPRTYCPRPERSALTNGYDLFADSFSLLVPRVFPRSMSERVIQTSSDISMPNGPGVEAELSALIDQAGKAKENNVLVFDHLLLPHAPWRYFPSGTQYDPRHLDGWYPTEYWGDEPWPVLQGLQRYLLQVGYVDSLIARVVGDLEQEGLYERSLIVVMADHGVSFRPGEGRRPLTAHNLGDIANVPLFVKYPHQARGRTDSRLVRTVDVLPTIADVLGITVPWHVDGVSLLRSLPERDVVVGVRRSNRVQNSYDDARLRAARTTGRFHAPLAELIRSRAETLERTYEAFGDGHHSLFRIGRHTGALGRAVSGVVAGSSSVAVRLDDTAGLLDVRPQSGYLPARISGQVVAGRLRTGDELAVAVDGRVQGLTTWFWDESGRVQRFRSLVPEGSFRPGRNRVDVYLVRGPTRNPTFVLLGSG